MNKLSACCATPNLFASLVLKCNSSLFMQQLFSTCAVCVKPEWRTAAFESVKNLYIDIRTKCSVTC